jgi:hypothetical protein
MGILFLSNLLRSEFHSRRILEDLNHILAEFARIGMNPILAESFRIDLNPILVESSRIGILFWPNLLGSDPLLSESARI